MQYSNWFFLTLLHAVNGVCAMQRETRGMEAVKTLEQAMEFAQGADDQEQCGLGASLVRANQMPVERALKYMEAYCAPGVAFSYDITRQFISVPNEPQEIVFLTNGSVMSNWRHTLGSENFVCARPGRYLVKYELNAKLRKAGAAAHVTAQATINETVIPESRISKEISSNEPQIIAHSFSLNAKKGDVITFQMSADQPVIELAPSGEKPSALVAFIISE